MKTIKVPGYSRDGNIEFTGIELPARRVVCPRCEGEGKHVNPAIDSHGISPEEFDADPDFAEGYFSGRYDVRCEGCKGDRVIDEVDEKACRKSLSHWKGLMRYRNAQRMRAEHEAECAAERRIGA